MPQAKRAEPHASQKKHERAVDVPMGYSRRFLQWHQVWPPDGQEERPGAAFLWRAAIGPTSALCWLGLLTVCAVNAVKAGVWELLNKFLAYAVSFMGCTYICLMVVLTQRDSLSARRRLLDFRKFGEPASLRGTCRLLNRLAAGMYVYSFSSFVMQTINGFHDKKECEAEFRRQGIQVFCGVVEVMIGRSITSLGETLAITVYQLSNAFLVMTAAAIYSCQFFEITIYIMIKVDHLNSMLETMFDTQYEGRYRERFNECVRYYSHIVQVAEEFNATCQKIMFVHYLLTGAIFGLLANLIIQNHQLSDIMHLSGWLFIFSLACFGGQLLANASERTCIAIYNSRWYEMDVGIQKDVLFLLLLAQRPIQMHAGPFGILGFPLLTSVMNTAYSYMTLMQTSKR